MREKNDTTKTPVRPSRRAAAKPKPEKKEEPKAPVNPVLAKPSLTGKLEATVTGYSDTELEARRIAIATLKRLNKVHSLGGEDMLKNLGDWMVPVRIGEAASKTGNAKKDSSTGGHYCRGASYGTTTVGDMEGREILLNIWGMHNLSAEDFFQLVVHETCHAWSDLIATSDKESDCNKAGGHRKYSQNGEYSFEGIASSTGWLEVIEIDSYAKLSTKISEDGVKMCKKLKVVAPSIGKVPAKKKAPAKRVSLMCEDCGFKIMVPTKKFENGEVALECAIHGKPMEEQKA